MEITDESLGLAKPKAKPVQGPMRPEYDDVRMKSGLGLKQQPKQWAAAAGVDHKHVQEAGACGGGGAGCHRRRSI